MNLTINKLIDKVKNEITEIDINKIKQAYEYALKHPLNRKRLNGDDYILHPLNVAYILSDLNYDVDSICAALLHETVNHGGSSIDEITNLFGDDIAMLVDSISKMNKLELTDDSNAASLNLRKVLVGLAKDVRVLFIKMADRIHNLRTGDVLEKEALKRKVDETMNVLIPIAHRLGINAWKSEMEDWCLKYSKPDVYEDILEKLTVSRRELEDNLLDMQSEISEMLIEHNISFHIKSRVKSVYSIYNKLSNGKKWNQIYDILALRIIVDKVSDCYLAIGLIHAKYRPIPGRFKDYIAMPKENMYQSLHTGIFGNDNHRYEVQIRTHEMDLIAEKGIASHWSYKEGGAKKTKSLMEQKLELFRNLIETSDNITSEDFNNQVQNDFLNDCIYVFTPKGDVVELPIHSTPIDFAYRIHSGVGDSTIGAIVNDAIVPLDYELQNNDIIEIKTNSNSTPNKEWLNFVKTSHAKNRIKSYFSKQEKDEITLKGKNLLNNELRKRKLAFEEILSNENIKKVCRELHFNDLTDIYFAIGSLRYTSAYIIDVISSDKKSAADALMAKMMRTTPKINKAKNEVLVSGATDILVSYANCCKPVFGDEIVGFITKGEGVKIHRKDCENILKDEKRLIEVEWNNEKENTYEASIIIETLTAKNNLLDIISKATTKNVNVYNIKTKVNDLNTIYEMSVKVKSKDELDDFINSLYSLKVVKKVKRL